MAITGSDFVLGIDLGGTKMALATADTHGKLIHQQVLPTLAEHGADQAIARAIAAGRQLVEHTQEEFDGTLVGVGVANMGITLADRVLMAPNVPGWDRLAIPDLMQQAFSTERVCIENDVKVAALAEVQWGALDGINTGIYLNLGTGIAVALIIDGRILRGAHGAAGEIAYNLRQVHEEVGALHKKAPLEEYVGGRAIGERASLHFSHASTAEEVFRLAGTDTEAQVFVEATVSEIAFHLTNLTIALDPERIVVGGGLIRSKEIILPRLQAHVNRFVPFPPLVVEAHFSHDAGLMGAIALALPASVSRIL